MSIENKQFRDHLLAYYSDKRGKILTRKRAIDRARIVMVKMDIGSTDPRIIALELRLYRLSEEMTWDGLRVALRDTFPVIGHRSSQPRTEG